MTLPATVAQFLPGGCFVGRRFGVAGKPQAHCVPVFFELAKSAVQFNYFHTAIVALVDLLVNLPINTPLCQDFQCGVLIGPEIINT